MDFEWTADHLRLRRGAVEFAAARLVDGVARRDREGDFSREAWQACADFGLQGLLVPAEWNGADHDLLSAKAPFLAIVHRVNLHNSFLREYPPVISLARFTSYVRGNCSQQRKGGLVHRIPPESPSP